MKKLVTSYIFNAGLKTIQSDDFINLDSILLITNVTSNTIIYNFADPLNGGILNGSILNLTTDCSTMNNNDRLQIFIDSPNTDFEELTNLLSYGLAEIVHQLQAIRNDGGMADALGRVRTIIDSGTVTTVGTITTVGNLGSFGGFTPQLVIPAITNNAPQQLRKNIIIS